VSFPVAGSQSERGTACQASRSPSATLNAHHDLGRLGALVPVMKNADQSSWVEALTVRHQTPGPLRKIEAIQQSSSLLSAGVWPPPWGKPDRPPM